MSTIDFFTSKLREDDMDRKLVFAVGGTEIGAGFHVTELKLADVKGIDCGANVADWRESTIQLLDGHGGQHMRVGKFKAIVDKAVDALPGLGDAPLRVEFAPRNKGKQLFQIGDTKRTSDTIRVTLLADRALCKPANAGGDAAARVRCC